MIIWDVQHLKGIAAASCNNSYTQVYICILLSSKKQQKNPNRNVFIKLRAWVFFRTKFRVKEMITSILTQRYNRLFFVWELVFAFEKKKCKRHFHHQLCIFQLLYIL